MIHDLFIDFRIKIARSPFFIHPLTYSFVFIHFISIYSEGEVELLSIYVNFLT